MPGKIVPSAYSFVYLAVLKSIEEVYPKESSGS